MSDRASTVRVLRTGAFSLAVLLILGIASMQSAQSQDVQESQGQLIGALPPDGGVAIMQWSGGSFESLEAATAGAVSFWLSHDGTFVGYIVAAPPFVNASVRAMLADGWVPPQTLVVSRAVSQACPPGSCSHAIVGPSNIDCALVACVALTFDDGPSRWTEGVLDVLAEHGARATFFVEGRRVKERPEVLARIAAAGHEIGNHTYSHPDLTHLDASQMHWEINYSADLIEEITGTRPTMLRPPFGAWDERVRTTLGMPIILWSVDPKDWSVRNAAIIEERVTTLVHPGAVVLLHDTEGQSLVALPAILAFLAEQNYVLVTVTELFGGQLEDGRVYTKR